MLFSFRVSRVDLLMTKRFLNSPQLAMQPLFCWYVWKMNCSRSDFSISACFESYHPAASSLSLGGIEITRILRFWSLMAICLFNMFSSAGWRNHFVLLTNQQIITGRKSCPIFLRFLHPYCRLSATIFVTIFWI